MDTIIQFVCFSTNLEMDIFFPEWEYYARGLTTRLRREPVLQYLATDTKNKYRYISQHEESEGNFSFSFMKDRESLHFPDHNVRVMHAGGYFLEDVMERPGAQNANSKLIVFTNHHAPDLAYYNNLPFYCRLNLYSPYYENCLYENIIEIYTPVQYAKELQQILEQRAGTEAGIYKERLALHML